MLKSKGVNKNMKNKILSFLLAFAMIFSAFLPAADILPAIDSAALISAQNANIAPVQVGTLGELVFAMENSVAGQTITLTNDIKSSNAYDWQMDISADGILVLDLNGYDIELNSQNTAVLFNITKATEFHIIDTKAKVSNLGSITFSSKVKDKEISVIAVDNKDAHLSLHNLVTIFLKPYPGDATLPEKSSILRFGAFEQFNNYGTNLNSTIDNTLGVSFQPARDYNYDDSDFGWYKGIISTAGACFDFDLVNKSAQKDFIRFGNITMMPGSEDVFKDHALKCYHNDSSPVAQFFMMDSSKMTVKVGGTEVSDNKALNTISSRTKVEYVSSCTHGSYNDVLSYTAGHIKVCSYCGNNYTFESHSIGTPSAYKEPDANTAGKTSGVKCNTAGCTYDLGVYLPKISEPVVDGTTIYVEDYDELQSAFLKARANDIIKLSNDISFNDLYSTYSVNTAVLRPQARGRLVLDLNGYDIIARSASTKYLFDLSMFDPLRGAVSLYIVNSSSDKEAKISFEEASYDGSALVNLDNNAAGLFIADDVKLAISSSQTVKDTSVIYARRFRELRIYRGQLQNALSTGVGIMFRPGSAVEYNNAKFSIDGSKITAPDACLDATTYAYKEFRIGSADLIANSGKRAIKAIDTETAKLSNIIRSGYQAAGVDNSTLLKNISKNAIYFRTSNTCSHANTATVLIYDLSHRVYCTKCYSYNDNGAHNLVPESGIAADCSNPGHINYTCVCGHTEKEIIDPTGDHSGTVINARPATCSQPGVKEAYFKCEMCKKYFLESTKAEIEPERVIIPPHGSTLITDKSGRNHLTLKKDATCTLDGIKESYYTCKICNAWISTKGVELDKTANIIPKLSHKLTAVGANPATCTTDGNIAHWKCERENCGMLFSDAAGTTVITDVTIKAAHSVQKVAAVKPTCTVNGNIEHYKCTVCNTLFSDAAGKTAITDVTAKATGHSYEWVVTKPAEVGKSGEQAYTCKVCKDVKEKKPIAALEPDYMLGDVDMNGEIKAADARLALRASVGLETLSEIQKKAADVDKNGEIKAADARLILRASVGLETLK